MTDTKTYDEVLNPKEELKFDNIDELKNWFGRAVIMNPEEKKEAIETILSQKFMADVYSSNGIAPEHVSEYIEKMKTASAAKQNGFLTGFASNLMEADGSMNKDGAIRGREHDNLKAKTKSMMRADMAAFAQSKLPLKEKKNSNGFKKAMVIAAGVVTAVMLKTGLLKSMLKETEQNVAKTEKVNTNTAPKADNKKDLTLADNVMKIRGVQRE